MQVTQNKITRQASSDLLATIEILDWCVEGSFTFLLSRLDVIR